MVALWRIPRQRYRPDPGCRIFQDAWIRAYRWLSKDVGGSAADAGKIPMLFNGAESRKFLSGKHFLQEKPNRGYVLPWKEK